MKKISFVLLYCLLYCIPASSQKIQYGGMQQLHLNFGESGLRSGFTFINGIRFHKFFTGIGADSQYGYNRSYSNQSFNTSALYADVRYYINKKKNFFAKTNGGVNLINQKLHSSVNFNYKKLTGYYTAFGLGFKAKLSEEVFYSFDINYCIRQTQFHYNYRIYGNEWRTEKYDLRQFAILVNMGIEIF